MLLLGKQASVALQVPLLLKDLHIEMRTLGAELLAVFTKVQSQVDNKLDSIQSQVPQVCPSHAFTFGLTPQTPVALDPAHSAIANVIVLWKFHYSCQTMSKVVDCNALYNQVAQHLQ